MAREKLISTTGRLSGAHWEISRSGFTAPSEAPEVIVTGTLYLPAITKGQVFAELRKDLQFGDRLCLLGHPLRYNWGSTTEKSSENRFDEITIKGETWADAFNAAEAMLEKELKKLEQALEDRIIFEEQAEHERFDDHGEGILV